MALEMKEPSMVSCLYMYSFLYMYMYVCTCVQGCRDDDPKPQELIHMLHHRNNTWVSKKSNWLLLSKRRLFWTMHLTLRRDMSEVMYSEASCWFCTWKYSNCMLICSIFWQMPWKCQSCVVQTTLVHGKATQYHQTAHFLFIFSNLDSNPCHYFSKPVLCPLSYWGSSVVVGQIKQ